MSTTVSRLTLALLGAFAAALHAQERPTATLLASADSAFRAQDWKRSEALYLTATERDSTFAQGWFRLGISAHNAGDRAQARRGFTKSLALGFQPGNAAYRLARIEAVENHQDSSVALLKVAVRGSGGNVTPELLKGEADFAALQRLPIFASVLAVADSVRYPCRYSAQATQFDFWIGEWDVTPWALPPTATHIGYNDIHPLLDHCVLLENWRDARGREGKSFNWYDGNTGKWRQAWMADGGGALDYTGEYRDGAMRFEGWTLGAGGSHVLQKLTFFSIHPDTVRQLFEQSVDSGRTWQPTFDGRYARVAGSKDKVSAAKP